MTTERVERYVDGISDAPTWGHDPELVDLARSAMAVADAELAEKDATIAAIRAEATRALIEADAGRRKAEAANDRVEALADEWERVGGFLPASQMQRLRTALRGEGS